jgi:hypothetical protein
MLELFTQKERANPEAFRDPDFQRMFNDAQEAYVRSGDDVVRENLVDLIARRSLEKQRSRLSITLNDAATRAAFLTANEFATLSLTYLVRHTQEGIRNFQAFADYISNRLMPFVADVSTEEASYWHLEAQGCATLEMGAIDLFAALRERYGGVLGSGFDRATLENHLPDGKKNALDAYVIGCVNDPSKLQPNGMNKDIFLEVAKPSGLSVEEITNVWNGFANTIPQEEQILQRLEPVVPMVRSLFDLYKNTPLKHLKLNTIGIAIAHANAVRVIKFSAPLDVWIK